MLSEEEFMMFYCAANEQEKKVIEKIGDFEQYFDDMIFEKDSISGDLIRCESQTNTPSAEWIDDVFDIPDELQYFSPTHVRLKIEDLGENIGGSFNVETDVLTIPAASIEKDSVILHEMIHIYEKVLNNQPMYFHDSLYWALYSFLKTRIDDLDTIITRHAHLLNEYSIYSSGGLHDILFLLKSFDLDIRMNYPLGTVFDYGYSDDLKKYTYR